MVHACARQMRNTSDGECTFNDLLAVSTLLPIWFSPKLAGRSITQRTCGLLRLVYGAMSNSSIRISMTEFGLRDMLQRLDDGASNAASVTERTQRAAMPFVVSTTRPLYSRMVNRDDTAYICNTVWLETLHLLPDRPQASSGSKP